MRVAIDATVVNFNREGIGNFTLQLLRHLEQTEHSGIEYILFVHPSFREEHRELSDQYELAEIPVFQGFASGIRTALKIRGKKRALGVDLFISTHSHLVSLVVNPNFWLVHDISPIVHPEYFNIDISRVKNQLLRYNFKRAIEKTKQILTTSEFNRREITKNYYAAAGKIRVIGAGPASWVESSTTAVKQRKALAKMQVVEGQYLLFIGTLSPRKNIERLLIAYTRYLEQHPNSKLDLVIAGKKGWEYDSIFKTLAELEQNHEQLNLDERIKFTGFVEDEDMNALARNCKALIYPPLYEGFGMPPLEALLLGKEVILSSIPVLREHYSGFAHFFPPRSSTKLAEQIENVANGRKQNSALKQEKLQEKFAWERVAKQLNDAIVAYAKDNWGIVPSDN
ncbi:MAG: glycosyltransferase family 4 protein [Candidatus Dojkabacteria bacterium]